MCLSMLQNGLVQVDITPTAIVNFGYLSVALDSCVPVALISTLTQPFSHSCPKGCCLQGAPLSALQLSKQDGHFCSPRQAWFSESAHTWEWTFLFPFLFSWCYQGQVGIYVIKSALEICRCLNNKPVKPRPPGVIKKLAGGLACVTL